MYFTNILYMYYTESLTEPIKPQGPNPLYTIIYY